MPVIGRGELHSATGAPSEAPDATLYDVTDVEAWASNFAPSEDLTGWIRETATPMVEGIRERQAVVASVVSVGCNPPSRATLRGDARSVRWSLGEPTTDHEECAAPVVTVALAPISAEDYPRSPLIGDVAPRRPIGPGKVVAFERLEGEVREPGGVELRAPADLEAFLARIGAELAEAPTEALPSIPDCHRRIAVTTGACTETTAELIITADGTLRAAAAEEGVDAIPSALCDAPIPAVAVFDVPAELLPSGPPRFGR